MPIIKPISDLRNYNKVLRDISWQQPVFLTKNGRGKFAIIDIVEYEKLKDCYETFSRSSQLCDDLKGKESFYKNQGDTDNSDKEMDTFEPKRYIVWSKNKIDLNDHWQKKWYIKQVLNYGKASDIKALDLSEVEMMLKDLNLAPEVKQLWESYFDAKRQKNFNRTPKRSS